MSSKKDSFGFVGSRISLTEKNRCFEGCITRYEEETDRYFVEAPNVGTKTYSRGEIIAFHAKFLIKKDENGENGDYQDYTSRYVGVPLWCGMHKHGIVKSFYPFKALYLVEFASGREAKLTENEVIDRMIALLKRRRTHSLNISHANRKNINHSVGSKMLSNSMDTKDSGMRRSMKRPHHSVITNDDAFAEKNCSRDVNVGVRKHEYRREQMKSGIRRADKVKVPQRETSNKSNQDTISENSTTIDLTRFYIVERVKHVDVKPLKRRSSALKILRVELIRLLENSESVKHAYKIPYDILINPDLMHYVSIRRFLEQGGLAALNCASSEHSNGDGKTLDFQEIFHVLKIIAMLPVIPHNAIESSPIGPTIMLVMSSTKVPACVRDLAVWIQKRWIRRSATKATGLPPLSICTELGNQVHVTPVSIEFEQPKLTPSSNENNTQQQCQSQKATLSIDEHAPNRKLGFSEVQSCTFRKNSPPLSIKDHLGALSSDGKPKARQPVKPILRSQSKYTADINVFYV